MFLQRYSSLSLGQLPLLLIQTLDLKEFKNSNNSNKIQKQPLSSSKTSTRCQTKGKNQRNQSQGADQGLGLKPVQQKEIPH